MPEIEFFAVEPENGEMVEWLLEQRCILIPDMHYESASLTRLTGVAAVRNIACEIPHFFVIRDDLIESPLSVREVHTPEKHFYYVDPRTGGPCLELYCGRRFEQHGRGHLSASWLSVHPWYEDSVTRARKKLPKDLLSVYSGFAKVVRAKRRRIKPGKREFWVSEEVERLVRDGLSLVGLENFPTDALFQDPAATSQPSQEKAVRRQLGK
jgi:hypothetical protein